MLDDQTNDKLIQLCHISNLAGLMNIQYGILETLNLPQRGSLAPSPYPISYFRFFFKKTGY